MRSPCSLLELNYSASSLKLWNKGQRALPQKHWKSTSTASLCFTPQDHGVNIAFVPLPVHPKTSQEDKVRMRALDQSDLNRELPLAHWVKDRFFICDMVTAWIVAKHLSWPSFPEWDAWDICFQDSLEPDFPRKPRVCYPTFGRQLQLPKWSNELQYELQNDCCALILKHRWNTMHMTE